MFKGLFKKSKSTSNSIIAPIDGEIVALEEVPDPVFSQKMMGDGVAIKPTSGKIVAPVDGEVVQVAPTKHAIGIRAEDGTEILIHVGLETVSLNGEGFTVDVNTGDQVSVGQPMLTVNLEYVKENAKDIITPIVITNSNNSDKEYTVTDQKDSKAGETILMTYE
ncbi:PTS glucose transporter subunit IIA [Ornithinibacillus sp. L9]|uniref:PTS glucose transporter subunit IIA n=1 Tax=Ornithinibacillus caprae TaxID=2678566 RepID=A0A6N8FKP7_9BACI|nr:PTS glucose transporter subunit IIA [Ornithinibacillus caprae]MUK88557.1 PTS glucose transporter subunit IIA [Ornithinibacillus caprae]